MIEELNKRILEWWDKLPDDFKGNLPTFIHELNNEAKILFVGLNPGGRDYQKKPIENISKKEIKDIMEKERIAIFGNGKERTGQYKIYYRWLSGIADDMAVQYEHCDLFQMSYSPSKKVIKEIFVKDFILKKEHREHLSVYNQILEIVEPKVVITNNINTANILRLHHNLKFNRNTGMYKNKNDLYFYLNGIMSYGRQTEYDKERLIWVVRKVL